MLRDGTVMEAETLRNNKRSTQGFVTISVLDGVCAQPGAAGRHQGAVVTAEVSHHPICPLATLLDPGQGGNYHDHAQAGMV